MFYIDKDKRYTEAPPLGAGAMLLIALLIALAGSFLPGLPRGAVFGHEWGIREMPMPLRLPLIRPIYLTRGESVEIDYQVLVRMGRLSVKVTYATNPFGLVLQAPQETTLAVSNSANGTIRYNALRDGFYLFSPSTEVISSVAPQCTDRLFEFWKATLAEHSACPKFNISYRLTYFVNSAH